MGLARLYEGAVTQRVFICLLLLLTSCAPLHHHESVAGDAGEVLFRVIAAPLTLGLSEFIQMHEAEQRLARQEREEWLRQLSPDERARQDQREAVGMIGLGLALSGSQHGQSTIQIYQAPTYPMMPLTSIDRSRVHR